MITITLCSEIFFTYKNAVGIGAVTVYRQNWQIIPNNLNNSEYEIGMFGLTPKVIF